jgi:hypothetical protein
MDNKSNYIEDLKTIKKIMSESSRFLSLSGLSGLFAGIIALIGAAFIYFVIPGTKNLLVDDFIMNLSLEERASFRLLIIIDALVVLILAIGAAFYFSFRTSHNQGLKLWTPVSKRFLVSFLIPLVSGGIFIIILYFQSYWHLLVPAMLIFYGLALVNAGKFTYNEVFYLGLIEILTGLLSAIIPGSGLIFWCIGFGFLHIAYGLIMYRKYER